MAKKSVFAYEWKLQWLPSSEDNAYVYIHKKRKKCNTFSYTKNHTLFKKLDNSRYVYIYKKAIHLTLLDFRENFEVGIYIQKVWQFALHDFLYTKYQTLHKKQDNLRYVFIYKNPETLRYAIFYWIFEIGRGGGGVFLYPKNNALCITFLYYKTSIMFYMQKSGTFALCDFLLNFWNLRRGRGIYL